MRKSTEKRTEEPGTLVLHIDDDPSLRHVVEAFLTGSGFSAISAADGASGLEIAQRERPAVVLLDVMMPDLDGYEVSRRLRASPGLERLAIIMLTATDDPKLNSQAFKAGADLTFRKPFDRNKLVRIIESALQLKGVRPIR